MGIQHWKTPETCPCERFVSGSANERASSKTAKPTVRAKLWSVKKKQREQQTIIQLSFKPSEAFRLSRLLGCLDAFRDWMTSSDHSLQLNTDKTEVLVVAPEKIAPMIMQYCISIGPPSSATYPNLCNVGVIFDQSSSFNTDVKQLTRSCFFHLRNISRLRSVVSTAELEMLIHAFISSH